MGKVDKALVTQPYRCPVMTLRMAKNGKIRDLIKCK